MADRKPLIQVDGVVQELPAGDTINVTSAAAVLLEISVVNGELLADYLAQLTPTLVNGELLVDIL